MRTRTVVSIFISILAILLIYSCATTPQPISLDKFDLIEVRVLYEGERFFAGDKRYYRFTPPSSGVYNISVTDADFGVGWSLHANAADEKKFKYSQIASIRGPSPWEYRGPAIVDLELLVMLNEGQEYYLVVYIQEGAVIRVEENYDLIITPRSQ